MKPFLFFVTAALLLLTACKKEDSASTPTNSTESYWRIDDEKYLPDTVAYYKYEGFPVGAGVNTEAAFVDIISKSNGQTTFLQFILDNNLLLTQNASISLDTQMQIYFRAKINSGADSIYGSAPESRVNASIEIRNGKAFIFVPEMWLYKYQFNGSYLVPVDSVRFSCNIQVPPSPTIIYGKDNYWKLNDTVFTFQRIGGISTPSATNPYTFYSLDGKNGNALRILDIKFVDPRTPGSSTPASVRVGKLFKIQLYASNSNNPSDTTYSSADTSDVYVSVGGQGSSATFFVPEMWVYRWRRDSQGNAFRDSVRFSCDIPGYY